MNVITQKNGLGRHFVWSFEGAGREEISSAGPLCQARTAVLAAPIK